MNLFFDTETTGIDKPGLVQLAAVLEDDQGRSLGVMSCLVEGVVIGDSHRFHGITQDMVNKYGVPEVQVLQQFGYLLARAELAVAHNAEFDIRVMNHRLRVMDAELRSHTGAGGEAFCWPEIYCTKDHSVDIIKIPPTEKMVRAGRGGQNKAPTLAEAFRFFTGRDLSGAHDALVDVYGCRTVYRGINKTVAAKT